MLNSNPPNNPKSTEEILREMEELSGDKVKADISSGGGALKSLLGFFVKVVPNDPPPGKVSAPASTATSPSTTPPVGPRVGDLAANDPTPKFPVPPPSTSPAAAVAELATKSFEEIYRRAKVPPSLCSIDDLEKLLENPAITNQPMTIKVVAVNLALSAKGISAEAPVTDAVRRDRALDAYQAMLSERVVTTAERNSAKIRQITKEIEEYLKRRHAEMDALKAEIATVKTQSVEFSIRREVEEKRLADLITPFLDGVPNPVTIGNTPDPAEPVPPTT